MESSSTNSTSVSFAETTCDTIREMIAENAQDDNANISLTDTGGKDSILCGLDGQGELHIRGDLGCHAMMYHDGVQVEIHGSVGDGFACGLIGGSITIHKDSGDALGAFATGGFLAGYQTSGDNLGAGLDGADVFVRQTVGDNVGIGMKSGTIVLGKSAGKNLGIGMTGGLIYLRGKADSIAPGVRKSKMDEANKVRLALLMLKAGIRVNANEFQVYTKKS